MDRKRKAAVLAMVLAAAAFCDVPFTAQAAEEKAAASSWTALAGQYENPYYQEKEGAALSPKVLSEWWKVFHDDTLDELIETALANNKDLAAARARFEESLAQLDGLPLRYDMARVNFAYGQTLRRAGKRREADVVIGTARELYLSLGARTYVARCERELKAGGLHQLRGSRDSVELTAQEEAVTSLVAQGLSNREVAAELYVSPKTVQYHLTRVYAKLGVRSRTELAALRR